MLTLSGGWRLCRGLAGGLLLFSFTVLLVLYSALKTHPVAHQLK